jgi:hypothetical protein
MRRAVCCARCLVQNVACVSLFPLQGIPWFTQKCIVSYAPWRAQSLKDSVQVKEANALCLSLALNWYNSFCARARLVACVHEWRAGVSVKPTEARAGVHGSRRVSTAQRKGAEGGG